MAIFLSFLLLFSTPLLESTLLLELLEEPSCFQQQNDLAPVEVSWEVVVLERHASGVPATFEFVDPAKENWPCKRVFLYENGQKQREVDLSKTARGVEEGALVEYYQNGQVELKACLKNGELQGPYYTFSTDGEPQQACHYEDGKLHGELHEFYPNGSKKRYALYVLGLLEGPELEWHQNGQRKSEGYYKAGLLHGKKIAWYHQGSVQAIYFFHEGLLHNLKGAARELYSQNGDIIERASFIQGSPEGDWYRFHQGGKVEMRVRYVAGNKEGVQEYFDEDGKLVGRRLFKNGKLIGKGFRYYPKAISRTYLDDQKQEYQLAAETVVDEKNLDVKVVEYFPSGDRWREYTLRQLEKGGLVAASYHGSYREWRSKKEDRSATIAKELLFDHGLLHGKQLLYRDLTQDATAGLEIECYFEKGVRTGKTREWSQDGVPLLEAEFLGGQLDGLYQTWYPSGLLCSQGVYKGGIPEENYAWHENGQKAYEAFWVDGNLHGKERRWNSQNVLILEQHWTKGLPDGRWKTWYDSAAIRSIRSFKAGKPCGLSQEFYENGVLASQATFSDGLFDGFSQSWFEDGSLAEQAYYDKGKLSGEHLRYMQQEGQKPSVILRENYVNGVLEGPYEEWFENGKKAVQCIYKHGLLDGEKRLWNKEGVLIYVGSFQKGRPIGQHKRVQESGLEEVAQYVAGQLEGSFVVYYPAAAHPAKSYIGKPRAVEASFSKGLLEDEYKEYTPLGILIRKFSFQRGLRHGEASLYMPTGELCIKAQFKNGKLHGALYEYYPNGSVKKLSQYVDGILVGREIGYYSNGTCAFEAIYVDGKLHGTVQEWSKEGVLLFQADYVNGLRHGRFNKYYQDGTPRVFQVYEDDVLVSKESFPAG